DVYKRQALAGVLGVGEGHLLHRKALRVKSADFAKSGSLFQSFLSLGEIPGVFLHCRRSELAIFRFCRGAFHRPWA
ncbi:UNVERIFIED_CONTAM: hypothetical protein O1L25_25335, partial [Pseudomonas aeruginosa]